VPAGPVRPVSANDSASGSPGIFACGGGGVSGPVADSHWGYLDHFRKWGFAVNPLARICRDIEAVLAFYKRIGVTADESFAPGDLEIEPAFDVVAEWQDYRFTAQVRHQDMIMTKLFEWMEVHGYRLREDFSIRLIAWLGRFSTKLSRRVQDLVANQFARIPPHMPRRTIATIVMLQKTAQPLLEEIQHQERVRIARPGHWYARRIPWPGRRGVRPGSP